MGSSILLVKIFVRPSLPPTYHSTEQPEVFSLQGLPMFQDLVINEMVAQLERLNKLGFKTFYINNIQPVGCLPSATRPDFNACNEISNAIVSARHNTLLVAAVANVTKRLPGATFKILDHFSAFTTVLRDPAKYGN